MQLLKRYKSLFVTKSGIPVKKGEEIIPKQNLLVRYNRTGHVLLNNQFISHSHYHRLLAAIEQHHPDAFVYANAYQIVFIYPKLTPEW